MTTSSLNISDSHISRREILGLSEVPCSKVRLVTTSMDASLNITGVVLTPLTGLAYTKNSRADKIQPVHSTSETLTYQAGRPWGSVNTGVV